MPHWDRSCRSNFLPHPVTVYWHQADQSSADRITPGAWQGHWSANFWVTGMTRPRKSLCKRDSNLESYALEADALTTRTARWLWIKKAQVNKQWPSKHLTTPVEEGSFWRQTMETSVTAVIEGNETGLTLTSWCQWWILNNNNNERISRALFHVKHAQLRWTGANTKKENACI